MNTLFRASPRALECLTEIKAVLAKYGDGTYPAELFAKDNEDCLAVLGLYLPSSPDNGEKGETVYLGSELNR
jgi:hypothetical protein